MRETSAVSRAIQLALHADFALVALALVAPNAFVSIAHRTAVAAFGSDFPSTVSYALVLFASCLVCEFGRNRQSLGSTLGKHAWFSAMVVGGYLFIVALEYSASKGVRLLAEDSYSTYFGYLTVIVFSAGSAYCGADLIERLFRRK